MSTLTRKMILLALVSCCAGFHSLSYSQTQTTKKASTASISGRVTVAGKGRAGIVVALAKNSFSSAQTGPRNGITDADGIYRITGVAPGGYYVVPISALFVLEDSNPNTQMGKPLVVSEGENVEGINFAMLRGSVITGKVTESDGRPVIEQPVTAIPMDQATRFYSGPSSFETDDRGVYRIFGLRAGRYRVAAGAGDRGPSGGRNGYQSVFYPNVTNVDQANIVELGEGEQATNIDITMLRAQPGFGVAGIIVNGEVNKPIANIRVALQKMNDDRGSFTQNATTSNQKGEFRLEDIPPGKYSVILISQGDSELRADPLEFQLTDQDVTGLVVRAARGASVSGIVQVEGTNDPLIVAKLRKLRIYAWVQGGAGGGARPSLVAADGSFTISPLPAGILNFEFAALDYNQETALMLSRVERDGVVVPRHGFDIKAGEQVSGVKLVLTYGSGSVRGTVNFDNGPPAPGMRFLVRLNKPGDSEIRLQQKEVDARGRFLIEGVPPGSYELWVNAFNSASRERGPSAMQSITVADSATTEVIISIDLTRKP